MPGLHFLVLEMVRKGRLCYRSDPSHFGTKCVFASKIWGILEREYSIHAIYYLALSLGSEAVALPPQSNTLIFILHQNIWLTTLNGIQL